MMRTGLAMASLVFFISVVVASLGLHSKRVQDEVAAHCHVDDFESSKTDAARAAKTE